MKSDKLLTKQFVIKNNLILLTISISIISIFNIKIDIYNFSTFNFAIAIFVAYLLASFLIFLSKNFKIWKNTLDWFYGGQGNDKIYNYIVFPVMVSISEELMFRTILLSYFNLYTSSILFGLYHARPSLKSIPVVVGGTFMGLVFSVLYLNFGGLTTVVTTHLLFHVFVRNSIENKL